MNYVQKHLFEIKIFCNFINAFAVNFDQLNASLLSKCIHYLKKRKTRRMSHNKQITKLNS